MASGGQFVVSPDNWREADVFKRIFDALTHEPDMEYAMIDATIVKVHRHGQGGLRPLK